MIAQIDHVVGLGHLRAMKTAGDHMIPVSITGIDSIHQFGLASNMLPLCLSFLRVPEPTSPVGGTGRVKHR
jgi:hypothetical protein